MKNKLIPVILIATAFGLLAGAAGALFTNVYTAGISGGFDFNRELNLNNYGYLSPGLIIRDAKKVVVNQDVKVDETIRDLRSTLLGVYVKQAGSTALYDLKAPFAQALAATTDGWAMVAWPEAITVAEIAALPEEYILVDNNRKVYEVDQALGAPDSSFIFMHLRDATSLSVRRLVEDADIKPGLSVLLAAEGDRYLLDTLSSKTLTAPVLSSDVYSQQISLSNVQVDRPYFMFNLSGEIVGAVDWEGNMIASPELNAYWRSLLKTRTLALPSFGVNYLDLSAVVGNKEFPEKGALLRANGEAAAVLVNGSAAKAGLKTGDIITRIDGTEINQDNNLSVLIANYSPGDRLLVSYIRDGVASQTEVTLTQVQ
ncbi:MAG: PDZ domain-containing protein [bacterium]|nr:PDZ domain-containing protein [bacterium]